MGGRLSVIGDYCGYCRNIKKKPEEELGSDLVVLSVLISFIHTHHALVVQFYHIRALHQRPCAIPLFSQYSVCGICLVECGERGDWLLGFLSIQTDTTRSL